MKKRLAQIKKEGSFSEEWKVFADFLPSFLPTYECFIVFESAVAFPE